MVLAAGAALGGVGSARAGIAWNTRGTISGDSDVFNVGTALYGYDLDNSTQTVNGVVFTGSSSTTALGTDVTLAGITGSNYQGFGTTSAPFNNLSTAYKAVLGGGDYTSAGTAVTVTLNNLTTGHIYATQFWVDDSRAGFLSRTETLSSTGGNATTLSYTNSNSAGGVGQYAVGLFTAGGATQAFVATGNASTQINALQVRDVSSTAWSGAASSNLGGPDANFNGGADYATANASSFLTFADSDGAGNAVTNSTLNPVPGAITSGVLNFINSTVAYTVNGGIAGASVNASGSGTVTFNGSSTLGALSVNAGTVSVAGTLTTPKIAFGASSATVSGAGSIAIGGGTITSAAGTTNGVNQVISAPLTGSGGLTIQSMGDTSNSGGGNSSILFLTGANTFTGNVNITAGLVDTGTTDAGFGNAANVVILNGGGLLANANTTYANTRNIQLAGTGFFRTYGSATFTVPGIISGTGPLTKTDGGVLVLSNQNTYAGGTALPVGTISVGASSTPTSGTITSGPLGTGPVTLSGGTLSNTGNFIVGNALVVTGTSNVNAGSSGNLTVTGAITGSGTVQNNTSVSNSVFVQGDISGFTGTIAYNDVNGGNNFGFNGTTAASQNASGAKLVLSGATTSTRSMAVGTAAATTFQAGALSGTGGIIGPAVSGTTITLQVGALNTSPGAFAGILSNTSGFVPSGGTLALTKVGTGTLLLSGANTYTGATTITAGSLTLGADNRLADASPMSLGGGTFNTGGFSETIATLMMSASSNIDLGAGASVLHYSDSSAQPWSGMLTIDNWSGSTSGGGTDQLFFGSSAAGLTPAQLSQITFSGFSPGATILSTGEVVPTPEPATAALLALGAIGLLTQRRRRTRRAGPSHER